MTITEVIPAALEGERLDRVVALVLDVSRAVARGIVESGGVAVDGSVSADPKLRLHEGQVIGIDPPPARPAVLPAADPNVEVTVVHADEEILVVNKQAGLVVHPAPGHTGGTLVNGLLALYPGIAGVGEPSRPGIVHRLDSGTTGLMVVARTDRAYRSLVGAIAAHEVVREYLALVWGCPEHPTGTIDAPIGRDPRNPLRMAVVRTGKPARTRYEVTEQFGIPSGVSLLRCTLETGRTHQIRVHLAAAGHPVVGDATYGGSRPALRAPRPMLHARRLGFSHPLTGEPLEFLADQPEDMSAVIAACGEMRE